MTVHNPFAVVKLVMENCNISLRKLAAETGIHRPRLQALLDNKKEPTYEEMISLNDALERIDRKKTKVMETQERLRREDPETVATVEKMLGDPAKLV